jgi:hypothetical protein
MMDKATPLPKAGRSAELRSRLAVAQTIKPTARGIQFRQALNEEPIDYINFDDVVSIPDWLAWTQTERDRLAIVVAILLNRPAIDQELSGAKLAALALAVGQDLFDELCNSSADHMLDWQDKSHRLPRPEDLRSIGEGLMHNGLPKTLSRAFPGASGDVGARAMVEQATKICIERQMDILAR